MPHIYTPENLNNNAVLVGQKQSVIVLGAVRDPAGRVLVAKRVDASVPDAAGKWEFVGGKVDFGETPEHALLREVAEESGLSVKIKRLLPKIFTKVWLTDLGQKLQVFLLTYECEVIAGELSNSRVSDEIGELAFVTLDELRALDALPNVLETADYL